MEIKESHPGEIKILAVSITSIILISVFYFFLYSKQNSENNEQLQKIYDKAYIEGYLKGKEDGASQILELRHTADSLMWKNIYNKNNIK